MTVTLSLSLRASSRLALYPRDVELIRSSHLRARHAFTFRTGGVSAAPYDSLNLSPTVGDDARSVHENLRRLSSELGSTPEFVATMNQVHGDAVLEATVGGEVGKGDGLVTSTPNLLLGVRTADCLPILIESPREGRVAAVHAGWRGVISEIVVRALERFEHRDDVRVAIGPAIQACCFEVDGDLPDRFSRAFGDDIVVPQAGKPKVHLDLGKAVRRSLERAGVPSSHVDVLPHCTSCDQRFFSHRRDKGVTGRHLALIRCEPATRL